MKNCCAIICFLLMYHVDAQIIIPSAFSLSPSAMNPALTSYGSDFMSRAWFHQSYTGISDGANTSAIMAEGDINLHQFGAYIAHDAFGIDAQNNITLRYAYQFKINDGILSAGVQCMANQYQRALTQTHAYTPDDPTLAADISMTAFNAGIGAAWITDKAYAAIAVPELLQNNLSANQMDDAANTIPVYLQGAYTFALNDDWNIAPVMWSALQNGAPMILDLQADVTWKHHLKLNLGYRNTENWTAGVHALFDERFIIGYQYDMHLPTGANAHEITLGFDLNNTLF